VDAVFGDALKVTVIPTVELRAWRDMRQAGQRLAEAVGDPVGARGGIRLAAIALVVGMLVAGAAGAQDVPSLLKTHNCDLCHSERETRTGPSYVDMAVKYRNNPKAASILVAVIRKGVHGGGPWPMPPLPEVPPADANRIAAYILSLKP
jgi:cytochrome c551/c552